MGFHFSAMAEASMAVPSAEAPVAGAGGVAGDCAQAGKYRLSEARVATAERIPDFIMLEVRS